MRWPGVRNTAQEGGPEIPPGGATTWFALRAPQPHCSLTVALVTQGMSYFISFQSFTLLNACIYGYKFTFKCGYLNSTSFDTRGHSVSAPAAALPPHCIQSLSYPARNQVSTRPHFSQHVRAILLSICHPDMKFSLCPGHVISVEVKAD